MVIGCEVFHRELCHAASRSPNQVDLEFLPKGLHDLGRDPMRDRLQSAIDRVDPDRHETIVLAYGLCNFGIAGLEATRLPLVLPRAHDCMTLFLGGHTRYLEEFRRNPGTYYLTTGWLERGAATEELRQLSIPHRLGLDLGFEKLVERFGEEAAGYVQAQLGDQTRHYTRIAFIETGLEPDDSFRQQAERRARDHDLAFERLPGDLRLFRQLVDGPWNEEDFLVVPAGQRVGASDDGQRIFSAPEAP
jgi:hypothetical protein